MAWAEHVTNETSRDESSTSWLVIGYYKITSDEAKSVLEVIFYFFFSGVISLCGTVANVINIVVFVKQVGQGELETMATVFSGL